MLRRAFCAMVGMPFTWLFKRDRKTISGLFSDGHDPVYTAIGEASMCWEHPERAGVFDSDRALEIADRLKHYLDDGDYDFAIARQRMCSELQLDSDLYRTYHANIAMIVADNTCLTPEAYNDVAEQIMKRLFVVDE